ncbi:hypothetical protein AWB81_06432 [Caballeronia arationis]|uniref:hypothetical protein n=1 Tax=Caballeronia arationis TaxID=1777142 RepID=UPI00074BF349|nr:hypothetical protein [Caballeronia arationis]SAL03493.1 hypothetical protein AWB81_06432 [Caballeronia arationis]
MKERPPIVFGRKVPADSLKAISAPAQAPAVNKSREPNTMTAAEVSIRLFGAFVKKDPGRKHKSAHE